MESIEKLREWAKYYHGIADYADEIEREIADYYMKLPLDADGVPIHEGDEVIVTSWGERVYKVYAVSESRVVLPKADGTGFCGSVPKYCRHVKPRTIEDVLHEFAEAVRHERIECAELSESSIADFADEIRKLMEVDA